MLEDTNGIQIEKIAALAPDLIVGQYSGMTEKEYELLSQIAPTVAQSGDYADYGTPWDEAALRIGTAVGQPEQMQTIIDDVKAQIARGRGRPPRVRGPQRRRRHALRGAVRLRPGGPAVADARRPRLHAARRSSPADDGEFGASHQRGADRRPRRGRRRGLARPRGRPGGQGRLRQDHDGRARAAGSTSATPTATYYVAHSFVTPLSIPYVLERYVPQLAAAVDGDPDTVPPVVND